jgi:hypothetical protein
MLRIQELLSFQVNLTGLDRRGEYFHLSQYSPRMSPGWGARQSIPLISSGPVVLGGAKLVITVQSCRWSVILNKL